MPRPSSFKMNHEKSSSNIAAFLLLCFVLICCSGASEVSTTYTFHNVGDTDNSRERTGEPQKTIVRSATEPAAVDPPPAPTTDAVDRPPEQTARGTDDGRQKSSSAEPQTDPLKGFELVDERALIFGNVAVGYSVMRLESRDTIIAAHWDSFEGEPTTPFFWLLDAPTGTIIKREAWSFVFTDDNQKLVYGRPVTLYDDSSDESNGDELSLLKNKARKMGVPLKDVKNAVIAHGSFGKTDMIQPVVRDMKSGAEKVLSIIGGGLLQRMGRDIIGLPRPRYYEFLDENDTALKLPQKLDIENGHWLPIKNSLRDKAVAALKGPLPFPEITDCELGGDYKIGDVLLTTRDKKLGLVIVARFGQEMIGGARLPEGWSGEVLCP